MKNVLLGIDCGSTTVKTVVYDEKLNILYKEYNRHHSMVRQEALRQFKSALADKNVSESRIHVAITGSAGLGLAENAELPFVQEVFATKMACRRLLPELDAVVELGGEDAKILFLTGGSEERMNGSCAGGTGAFIDQMASLLSVSVEELDKIYFEHGEIYDIASRCGVFAKSDIQPLLNQGARKADIAASIYQAIVGQTISGLAQGRELKGKIAFLGGPLTFGLGLRDRFVKTLGLKEEDAIFPDNAEYFVSMGAALMSEEFPGFSAEEIEERLKKPSQNTISSFLPPLFENEQDYRAFKDRHAKADTPKVDINTYSGKAYLGIDAGSTTTKMVLISEDGGVLYSYYAPNLGEPLPIVKDQLLKLYDMLGGRIVIAGAATTGYGEELLKNAFHADAGEVETAAHFYAAREFDPNVDFILDIGGQDMKCIRVKNGVIDSILLNEACSSGCGSFIESFAHALGYETPEFAALGLFAKNCVNLGSRCTVFMNSSVKQAQKDGASVEDISAGLSISVVKNALYKVIRARDPKEIGQNIVVQGGTFMNDAILRAFEQEIGRDVVRPKIAGLMGAYGAAVHARSLKKDKSSLLSKEELLNFTHSSKSTVCKKCQNMCKLTVNTFADGGRFISGNRCERAAGGSKNDMPNLYEFKLNKLNSIPNNESGREIGIPLGLNLFENLPFWQTMFVNMGFKVVVSDRSSRKLYMEGQHSIPSDTVCYPAKLMHGHIESLLKKGVNTIFYPCMPYNFDENLGENHYNCPVVAGYPELLNANVAGLKDVSYLFPYFGPHREKSFTRRAVKYFKEQFGMPAKVTKAAVKEAYKAFYDFRESVYSAGDRAIAYAREHKLPIIILAGRPYHIDPEINHGIDVLLGSLGCVVVSEDAIRPDVKRDKMKVLNQWTYHARLYEAARYACEHEDTNLVQLVSFGCGLDAITTDQVKDILEAGGKPYTQIKIDEISNLGAAKIRLRSLLSAIGHGR